MTRLRLTAAWLLLLPLNLWGRLTDGTRCHWTQATAGKDER